MIPLDSKVYGVLFKVKDNTPIPPDEYIVFRAADNAIVSTLTFYLDKCKALGANWQHIQAVEALINRVREWRGRNPERCKIPDTDLNKEG